MNTRTILHNIARLALVGALALFALAFLELAAGLFDTSLIRGAYAAGRLIELAAALLLPVIAITMREIRDALQANQPT